MEFKIKTNKGLTYSEAFNLRVFFEDKCVGQIIEYDTDSGLATILIYNQYIAMLMNSLNLKLDKIRDK